MTSKEVKLIFSGDASRAEAELGKLNKSFRLVRSEVDGLIKSAVGIGTLYAIGRGLDASVDASEQMQNSLRGLASVARYAGEDLGLAMQAASELTADGLLDIESSATALKNLLSRGFGLEESVQIVERLKDSAAFGRQANLSLAEAVKGATEGLKNENSVLVDNAGVTKNVSVLWKEYAAQIGKSVTDLSMAEKRQAEYNGILRETEGQLGNAKLAAEGLTGAKARMRQEVFEVSAGIGDVMTPAVLGLARAMNWALENFVRPFVGGLEILGARAGAVATKVGALTDWVANGFEGGPEAVKKEFRRLDEVFEEQAMEIARKWEGGIKIPEIGRDSGKRRKDVNPGGDGDKKTKPKTETEKEAGLSLLRLQEEEEIRKREFDWLELSAQKRQASTEALEEERSARENAIQAQLAEIDLAERERTISRDDAARQRLGLQRELLALQERHLAQIDKLADPSSWYAQTDAISATRSALVDLEDEMQRLAGTVGEGATRGFRDFTETARTAFEDGQKLAGDAAGGMMGALDDGLFDAMQGRLQSAEDYWNLFADVVMRSFSQILSQQAVVGILRMLGQTKEQGVAADAAAVGTTAALTGAMAAQTGVISSLTAAYWALAAAKAAAGLAGGGGVGSAPVGDFGQGAAQAATIAHGGGLILHDGGPVRMVPRFHFGGLARDEVPAVLQTGERVLSRQQNRTFDKLAQALEGGGRSAPAQAPVIVNMNVSAMDARSFNGYVQQNREAIAQAVAGARGDNNPAARGR